MQLDQLSTAERRGFQFAYRTMLRGLIGDQVTIEAHNARRAWMRTTLIAVIGAASGGAATALIEHLIK